MSIVTLFARGRLGLASVNAPPGLPHFFIPQKLPEVNGNLYEKLHTLDIMEYNRFISIAFTGGE
jgi:hypothetical protein